MGAAAAAVAEEPLDAGPEKDARRLALSISCLGGMLKLMCRSTAATNASDRSAFTCACSLSYHSEAWRCAALNRNRPPPALPGRRAPALPGRTTADVPTIAARCRPADCTRASNEEAAPAR